MKKIPVAILGATGLVGQKFIEMLENHPYFRINELVASEKSKGKPFAEVARPVFSDIKSQAKDIKLKGLSDGIDSKVVFSALPSESAKTSEWELAKDGKLVISKASANRMDRSVPLIVPEVNPEHIGMLDKQRESISGGLVCDPNCTTIILALTLKPLMDKFKIKRIIATSMQALSGAGHPGLASLEAMGNILPYIPGEEEKLEMEPRKIFGKFTGSSIKMSGMEIFGSCNRVPVLNGHTLSVHIEFGERIDAEDARRELTDFVGLPNLPSGLKHPIIVRDEQDRPQPHLDATGMAVTVGRIRRGLNSKSIAYQVVGDNLVRGAAGAGILDAELLVSKGYI